MGLFGFFINVIIRPHFGPGVDSDSNRNEYEEYLPCVGLMTLPPSYADCLEILGASIYWSRSVQACNEITFTMMSYTINTVNGSSLK